MAIPFDPEIKAYVNSYILPVIHEVNFKNSPVLTRLQTRNRERFNGGVDIRSPITFGELNGGPVGRGDAFDIAFVRTDTALVNTLKLYYVNISLYGFDSIANNGPLAAFSEVESKFNNAALTMAKLQGTDMYGNSVTDPRRLSGFSQWYDDGNLFPTVGGITRADILAPGTVGGLNAYTKTITSFTAREINTACGASSFGSDQPDLMPVTQAAYNLLWESQQPFQRFQSSDNDLAKVGFRNFRFNGADVVIDKYLPTGTNGVIFGMNTKYIMWWQSSNDKFNNGFTGFKEAQNSIDVAGQFLNASELVVPNPRTGFKILSTLF